MNATLRVILREIAVKEGIHSVTELVASGTSKMWFIQFCNTAIVLLILNAKLPDKSKIKQALDILPEDSPLLNGSYYDFLAEWYGVVGVSIAVSCFINAVTPLFNFGFRVAYGLFRYYDRGFT